MCVISAIMDWPPGVFLVGPLSIKAHATQIIHILSNPSAKQPIALWLTGSGESVRCGRVSVSVSHPANYFRSSQIKLYLGKLG